MGACKLVQDTKTSVAGVTLYSEGEGCIKPTGVYWPPSHSAASSELNVILWLHGWYVSSPRNLFSPAAGYETKLRESVLASQKDVVLVAPFLGHKWSVKEPDPENPGKTKKVVKGSLGLGDLGKEKGLQLYLKQVLDQIGQFQGGAAPGIKNLVIACHSGGGDLMRQATGALGDYLPNLKECWGYDCMYAMGETYGCWADGLPGVYFYFYLADGSYASYFAEFWKFAYGSPQQPEPQPMNNVFLAPATRGLEHLSDLVAFQSADEIQNKVAQGTKLNPYEEVRKKADPLVDNGELYRGAVRPSLTGHFPVVQDVFRPRIEGLFGAKPTGAKVMARIRQSVCKANGAKGHGTSKQKVR